VSLAYWKFARENDPVDFERACREFVAERPPCRICGARQYLTPTGIDLVHDRNLHGADRETPKKPPYHRSEPSRVAVDPYDP
jgi:hypothetical protein